MLFLCRSDGEGQPKAAEEFFLETVKEEQESRRNIQIPMLSHPLHTERL